MLARHKPIILGYLQLPDHLMHTYPLAIILDVFWSPFSVFNFMLCWLASLFDCHIPTFCLFLTPKTYPNLQGCKYKIKAWKFTSKGQSYNSIFRLSWTIFLSGTTLKSQPKGIHLVSVMSFSTNTVALCFSQNLFTFSIWRGYWNKNLKDNKSDVFSFLN